MEFVEQKHWDRTYEDCEFQVAAEDDLLRRWIERHIPKGDGSCLEIGCFPGTYLSVLGDLGYELNGIDLTPRVEYDLPNWLRVRGYRIGEFSRSDFRSFPSDQKYDVVCSFGFIEHFADWPDVLIKQALLVNENGHIVVSAPNFHGVVQKMLHLSLDRKNYSRHNVASMKPALWKRIVRDMGFNVLFSGYFGAFGFWVEEQRRNRIQKEALYHLHKLMPHIQKVLPKDKMLYSPFCGLIAKREKASA